MSDNWESVMDYRCGWEGRGSGRSKGQTRRDVLYLTSLHNMTPPSVWPCCNMQPDWLVHEQEVTGKGNYGKNLNQRAQNNYCW